MSLGFRVALAYMCGISDKYIPPSHCCYDFRGPSSTLRRLRHSLIECLCSLLCEGPD